MDNPKNANSRREIWIFHYKPAEILAASKKRLKHHVQRQKFWTSEADKAERLLKKKGFQYRPPMRSIETDIEIVGDRDLSKKVSECRRNVTEHKISQTIYETWVRALEARVKKDPNEELELTINDIIFFNL